jgi:hypothetical protein
VNPNGIEPLSTFSVNEYRIVRAVAQRIVGPPAPEFPDAGTIDAALRADRFLAGEDPDIQTQFHLLLTIFGSALFAFLFGFRPNRFLDMSPDDQDSWLEDWMTSRVEFRRKGFIALKRLCMSMHYTDARSWPEIRYEGTMSGASQP